MRNSNFLKTLFVITFSFLSIYSFAQTSTVTGNVKSKSDGFGIPGASVQIKGTTRGTITDIDGNFTIQASEGETLLFSFVGMTPQEVPYTGQSSIDVVMEENMIGLQEVVAIGYGVQKKEDKTGAVAQVTADDLLEGAVTDPMQAIAGKAAGVVVTKGGGNPTDDAKIKIRGAAGISGATSTDPLYVIDGVPNADPTMISPDDIETMNVLKDAASTAIYGSQGANGVIIITTKKGSAGAAQVNFSSTTSVDMVANTVRLLNAEEYRSIADYFGKTDDFVDGGANTDWQDEIFKTAVSQQYNLSMRGGSENGTYSASVTHQNMNGIIEESSRQRTYGAFNFTHKAWDNKLTFEGGVNVAVERSDYIQLGSNSRDDILYQTYRRNPTDPTHNEDGEFSYVPVDKTRGFDYVNPLGVLFKEDRFDDKRKILGNLSVNYEIMPGLNAKVMGGYKSNDKEYTYFRPAGIWGGAGDDSGAGTRSNDLDVQQTLESTLTYNKTIDSDHNISALAGYSFQENKFKSFGVNARNSQSESVGTDNMQSFIGLQYGDAYSSANSSRLIGFFGRVAYNYKSKYYLGGSIRRDGSSKFGENSKWGLFPTVSAGWSVHHEDFMDNLDWVSQLKLRASYGVSGNQSFGPYNSLTVAYAGQIVTDPITGEDILVWGGNQNENPDLQWEQTAEYNFGLDYGVFNNRLQGSFEFYHKNTTDMLNQYSVPVPPNIYPTLWANSGSMTNTGFEFSLSTTALNNRVVNWKTTVNLSRNVGKITSLGEYWTPNDSRQGWISGQGIVGGDNYTMWLDEGQPIGNFYLYKFAYFQNGQAMYYNKDNKAVSANALKQDDRYIAGNATPDMEISWSNNLTFFENWTMDFQFRGLFGQQMYNHTNAYFSSPIFFPYANVTSDAVNFMGQGFNGQFTVPSDLFLENASFVRLEFLSLGYNVPLKENRYLQRLSISAMANNLFVITNYSGTDPETTVDGLGYGVDAFGVYPKSRSFSLGIKATF